MLMFSLLAIVVVLNYEYARKRIPVQLSQKLVDKRAWVGRGISDESRRDAQATRVASLILAGLILFFLVTCVHMFSHLL